MTCMTMLESLKHRSGKRWPRGQKFDMSPSGMEAEASYRREIQGARAQGRDALSSAQLRWAEPLRLEPLDGVVLGELRAGRKSLAELARGLDDCGTRPDEVKAAIDRLAEAGLVAATPAAAPVN